MIHASLTEKMCFIDGGDFLMGSDRHYPEEAPMRRVHVDGFWIDEAPVTNREYLSFVEATDYRTLAEIPPDVKDYPGMDPAMAQAGTPKGTQGRFTSLRRELLSALSPGGPSPPTNR